MKLTPTQGPPRPPGGIRRRRRLLAAILAAAAITTAAACSSEENSPDSRDDADAGGGEFSVAAIEPDHLTPGWSSGAGAAWIIGPLYAPLAAVDENGQLMPVQAESITTEDNKVWTIKIKEGWTFHNGEEITAQAYVDTINYAAYGPNGWGNNYQTNLIEGYGDLNPEKGEPTVEKLSGLKLIDDYTFQITLVNPDSGFPLKFTSPVAPYRALPSVAFDDMAAFDEQPVGSGPFQMAGPWNHDVEIKMKAFDDYKGQKPVASAITFKIYQSPDAAYTDLQAGNVDIIGGAAAIPNGRLDQVASDFDDRVMVSTEIGFMWLGIPVSDDRTKDVRVRRAISMSIDRDGINSAIFGGYYTSATGILAPGFVTGSSDSCGDSCTYDPEAAKALLDEAGGFEGELVLYYPIEAGDEYIEAIANGIHQNLGIETTVKSYPNYAQFYEAIASEDLKGPVDGNWASTIAAPGNIVNGAFKCSGQYNTMAGRYCSPEIDEAITRAASLGGEESVAAYREMEQLILDELYTVPMFWFGNVYAYSENVDNVVAQPGALQVDYVKVTPAD